MDDVLIGKMVRHSETGLIIELLCTDCGPRRLLAGLGIRVFCAYNQCEHVRPELRLADNYSEGDHLRVVVIRHEKEAKKIFVTMKLDPYHAQFDNLKLGLMLEEQLPVYLYKARKYAERTDYTRILNKQPSFTNPASTNYLCETLVQPPARTHLSFLPPLAGVEYESKDMASALASRQNAKSATKRYCD